MKNIHNHLMIFILITSCLMSCQKNEDYVEVTKTPIEFFIRLSLDDAAIEENGFGAVCINENQEVMVISNKQELLSNEIDPNSLETGDFILVRQLQDSSHLFTCLYVMEYMSNNTPVIGVFIDETQELDSFVVDGNLVLGSHTGSFFNTEGVEVPYILSFSCGLTTSTDLCD